MVELHPVEVGRVVHKVDGAQALEVLVRVEVLECHEVTEARKRMKAKWEVDRPSIPQRC